MMRGIELSNTHHPICPKCGYDQSGAIATWELQCPVNGTCPECGLAFAWADVFDPSRNLLGWYSEHAPSTLSMLTRSPATIWRLLLPWIFWRSVKLTHPIALRRLAWWMVMMWVVLHVVMAIPFGYYNWMGVDRWLFGSIELAYRAHGVQGVFALISNALFSPLLHFIDTGGLSPIFFGGNGTASLYSFSDIAIGMLPIVGFSSTWVLILLVIPTTRRIAQIRSRHIIRAFIISLLPGIVFFEVVRFESAYSAVARITPSDLFVLTVYICFPWLIVFWASAIKAGWRLQHAWALIVLGTIAGVLGMVAVVLVPAMYFS